MAFPKSDHIDQRLRKTSQHKRILEFERLFQQQLQSFCLVLGLSVGGHVPSYVGQVLKDEEWFPKNCD